MIKNIIIVVLVVVCIGLMCVLLMKPDGGPVAAAPAPVPPPPEVETLPAPAARMAVATPRPEPAPVEPMEVAELPPEPPQGPFAAGGFAEMMERPEFRNMVVAQQKMAMEQQYGELFDMLELTPTDRSNMKDLLAERMRIDMERGIAAMQAMQAGGDPDLSGLDPFTADREAAQEAIRQFLGDEDFDLLEQYEATQPERMQVDMFKQSLGAGEELTWEQEDELVRALYEERLAFPMAFNAADPDSGIPTPEQMSTYTEEMARLNQRYIDRASEVLSPAQAERFRENVENMAAMQEMALGMAQQLFGGGEETE